MLSPTTDVPLVSANRIWWIAQVTEYHVMRMWRYHTSHHACTYTIHAVPEGNNGCDGGNMYNSFMYIIFNDGIDTTSSYKYQGKVQSFVVTTISTIRDW